MMHGDEEKRRGEKRREEKRREEKRYKPTCNKLHWKYLEKSGSPLLTLLLLFAASILPQTGFAQTSADLHISIPQEYGADDIVLGASRYLYIRNSVQVLDEEGTHFGMVGTTGATRVEIHNGAEVGDAFSNDHLWLNDNSTIHGDIWSPYEAEPQNIDTITVDGMWKQAVVPENTFSWRFDIPDAINDGVFLNSGQSLGGPLAPGRYSTLQLHPQTSITLTSGVYVFDAFQIDSDAEIVLDDTEGAIFIYVIADTNYWMRGNMVPITGDYARVMLAYTGSREQFIEKRFVGTIVSPNAKITVRSATTPHKGAIFAKDIEIDADAVIQHVPFGWLIDEIIVGPEEPCLGEPTSIWVDTFSNFTNDDISINIAGSSGSFRKMSFYGAAYERDVVVIASTLDGQSEYRTVKITPRECDLEIYPILSAVYDPLVEKHKIGVINSGMFSSEAVYHWILGDGTRSSGPLPELYHDYADYIDNEQLFTAFEIFVDVEEPDGRIFQGATTLKIMSDFAFDKNHNIFRPFVTSNNPNLPMYQENYLLEYNIENPDKTDAVFFSDALFEFVPCDMTKNSTTTEQSISTVVDPESSYSGFLILDDEIIPEDTCNIVLRFVGKSSEAMNAYGNVVYRFESESRNDVALGDIEGREFILNAILNGWGEEEWRISQKELLKWKMNGINVPDSLIPGTVHSAQNAIASADSNLLSPLIPQNGVTYSPFPSTRPINAVATAWNMGTTNQLIAAIAMTETENVVEFDENPEGKLCDPTQSETAEWGQYKYVCTPEMDENQQPSVYYQPAAAIINARKGDALLSRACSFVGDMLSVIKHQYSHTGIMTAHGAEVTHSILEIDRLNDNLNGGLKTQGIDAEVLQYGMPGVVTQSIEMAYWPFSQSNCNGDNWEQCNCAKEHFGDDLLQKERFDDCYLSTSFNANDVACSGTDSVKPLVVKPIPEYDAEVRSQLIAAADYAKSVRGHYRFYTYMRGIMYNYPPLFAPALSEWPDGEGTQPSSCAVLLRNVLNEGGGFSLPYSDILKPKVKQMAEMLYNGIKNKGLKELGSQPDFLVGLGGFLCGLFGHNCVADLVERGAEHAATQVANCFVHDECSDDLDNRTSIHWKDVFQARTLSPGHLIASIEKGGWPTAADGGPYGYFERPAFTTRYYSARHTWKIETTAMRVIVHVTDECQEPVEGAEVILLGSDLSGVTDTTGTVTFDNVPIGLTQKDGVLFRAIEARVQFRGVQETAVLSNHHQIDVFEDTVQLDIGNYIPEEHRITFAGIVQIFEDGFGQSGNTKQERPFLMEINLLPGKTSSADKIEICQTDALATLKLKCSLEADEEGNETDIRNPANNDVSCEIYSSIEQGSSCENLNDIDYGTDDIQLSPGQSQFILTKRDLGDDGVGHDDNMRFRGYLLHDFNWPDEFDVPSQNAAPNTYLDITQRLQVVYGPNETRLDTTENNSFALSWNRRIAGQQLDKCVNSEMVGHSIAVAILDAGRYPLDTAGDIFWPGVIKGSSNNIFLVHLAQGFNDNTCQKDEPFANSYFNRIVPAAAPGSERFSNSLKLTDGRGADRDDYMWSKVTLRNMLSAPVPGVSQCAQP